MKARITVEYLEPHIGPEGQVTNLEPVVIDVDEVELSQERPVEALVDPVTGKVRHLGPGKVMTTTITGKTTRRPPHIVIWSAPDAKAEFLADIRTEIAKGLENPAYSVVTNFDLKPIVVRRGDMLVGPDCNKEQTELLRDEMEKAWLDPDYIAVVPFEVFSQEFPREPTG